MASDARLERDFWQRSEARPITREYDGQIEVIRCPALGLPGGRTTLLGWRKAMVVISSLPGDASPILFRMARWIPRVSGLDDTLNQLDLDPDLVHGFNISWEFPLATAWNFAKRRNLPLVVTPFAHVGSGRRDRVALNSTMDHQRRIMSDARALLTLTDIEAERLRAWGVEPQYVAAIGGGLDPLPQPVGIQGCLNKYGLRPPIALFVGRANYDKGAIHAVQAALQLHEQGRPLTLVLIGQSSPEFDRLFSRLTGSQKQLIRPLGILGDEEKHALLEAASMLLLPSHSDSFGIVLLEAWAHGKPVIGARSGGIPAVIDEGENGILVPFADVTALVKAMDSLLTDPEMGKTMGLHGRQKVAEQYSWDSVGDRVLRCYQHILAVGP